MLKNAPTLAIRGVDTDENEPSKVSMKWGSQTGVAPVMYLQLDDLRIKIQTFPECEDIKQSLGPLTPKVDAVWNTNYKGATLGKAASLSELVIRLSEEFAERTF